MPRSHAYLLLALSAAIFCSCSGADRYVAFSGYAQGGTYTVKANLKGVRRHPSLIAADIDTLLVHIDNTLSGYNRSSQLSRLNSGERLVPDSMFLDIYARSYDFYIRSEGALDVASGPLFDIWGFGFTRDSLPGRDVLDAAMNISGMGRLRRDIDACTAPDGTIALSDLLRDSSDTGRVVLNFNAIAQGYSCDVIASYLHGLGVRDMLVDIGEIYCEGRNPSGQPWSIGIDTPRDGNQTPGADMQGIWRSAPDSQGQGVVTSGNYRKFYISGGRKYSHTIDPRDGLPVQHKLLSATVVAPDATTADAVATWCMVLGPAGALEVLAREGLEGCLIHEEDGVMVVSVTPGFCMEDH